MPSSACGVGARECSTTDARTNKAAKASERQPQSYRIPIQRIDGRCDRVRASTHRWLDEAATSKGACLRLTFSTTVHHRLPAAALRLARLFNIEPSEQALSAMYPDNDFGHDRRSADILTLAERAQPLHNPDITSFRTSASCAEHLLEGNSLASK
jgi:hypothetical protein